MASHAKAPQNLIFEGHTTPEPQRHKLVACSHGNASKSKSVSCRPPYKRPCCRKKSYYPQAHALPKRPMQQRLKAIQTFPRPLSRGACLPRDERRPSESATEMSHVRPRSPTLFCLAHACSETQRRSLAAAAPATPVPVRRSLSARSSGVSLTGSTCLQVGVIISSAGETVYNLGKHRLLLLACRLADEAISVPKQEVMIHAGTASKPNSRSCQWRTLGSL